MSRKAILWIVGVSLFCLAVIAVLGVLAARRLRTHPLGGAGQATREAATHQAQLLDPGSYAVGLAGKDRDGNPTHTRGIVVAAHPLDPARGDDRVLAEAVALLTNDVLLSVSDLPQMLDAVEFEPAVPHRDPHWRYATYTRDEGLLIAHDLAQDAVLSAEVSCRDGQSRVTFRLIDMASGADSFSIEATGASSEALLEAVPGALRKVLDAAHVTVSEGDRRFLEAPPFPAAEYVRAGRVVGWRPSVKGFREGESFVRACPKSYLAQWLHYWQWGHDWTPERTIAWVDSWQAAAGQACPATLLEAAAVFLEQRQFDRIWPLLQQYEAAKPNSAEAALGRGRALLAQKSFAQAIAESEKLIQMSPLSALAWQHLGAGQWAMAVHARGGRFLSHASPQQLQTFTTGIDAARVCLERAAELAPTNCDILTGVINVRVETDTAQAAEEALDRCDKVRPGYGPAYSAMSMKFTAGYDSDTPGWKALMQRADACRPEWPGDEIALAGVLASTWGEAAEEHYRRAAQMAPRFFPIGWWRIADGMLDCNYKGAESRQEEAAAFRFAEECIDKSVQQLPAVRARLTQAKLLIRARRYAQAETLLLGVLKERPNMSGALTYLAATQRCLEKWPEAEKTFRAAIKAMAPQTPQEEWYAVFQCMALNGRAQEARQELEKQRRTHAAYYQALGEEHLASCYLAMLEVDEAETILKAFPQFEGNWVRLDNMALCRIHRGDWQGAQNLFQQSHDTYGSEQVEPLIGLAVCSHKLGDRPAALKWYEEAEARNRRWLSREGLREQLWPPKGIEAFEALQAEWQQTQ